MKGREEVKEWVKGRKNVDGGKVGELNQQRKRKGGK